MDAVGIYVHIPFCRARCTYCDFNTYIGQEALFEPYVRALEREIRAHRGVAHTLFFGGGTPSLLTPTQLERLITACRDALALPSDAEITVECNPGTVTQPYLRALRSVGVNRLSFGAQSANLHELRLLGREHDWRAVVSAVEAVRAAGFDNLNLDLIFGLPYQTLDQWQHTLRAALALQPDHLSLYALTIEAGTPMHDWTRRGEVPLPDPDLAAAMYALAEEHLDAAGFTHYEISNWHRPDKACQHNLVYWRNGSYFGFGAGAHGATETLRYWRVRRPAEYIARAQRGESTIAGSETIEPATSRSETMMLGLRLLEEGVSQARFAQRYGAPISAFFAEALQRGEQLGLIEVTPERVRLRPEARFISNQAMMLFI
ncbi:MAG: radical SAM family heme chaperone HemW [Thermoflexales bacterium]|nr:radical SAM family heme chaperone HemW [Thermoflexales bacterium]